MFLEHLIAHSRGLTRYTCLDCEAVPIEIRPVTTVEIDWNKWRAFNKSLDPNDLYVPPHPALVAFAAAHQHGATP